MNKMQGYTLLKYRNFRYLKVSSALIAIAVIAYALIKPAGGESYGGTWLGYTLGVLSTLIMLLLMWYGVAKRRINGTPDRRFNQSPPKVERRKNKPFPDATLQEWLSAHIYLGGSLLVLVTLHTGFHFGQNIHTLSYILMLLVMASGFYGLNAYMDYPRQITLNMGEDTLEGLLLKISELDELAAARAENMPDEVKTLLRKAKTQTRIGGTLLQQLSGEQRNCPTKLASEQLLQLCAIYKQHDQPKIMRDLYAAMLRKEKLVARARTEVMLNARMGFWLYLHAPLGIALLAALSAHIVSIFFYW